MIHVLFYLCAIKMFKRYRNKQNGELEKIIDNFWEIKKYNKSFPEDVIKIFITQHFIKIFGKWLLKYLSSWRSNLQKTKHVWTTKFLMAKSFIGQRSLPLPVTSEHSH